MKARCCIAVDTFSFRNIVICASGRLSFRHNQDWRRVLLSCVCPDMALQLPVQPTEKSCTKTDNACHQHTFNIIWTLVPGENLTKAWKDRDQAWSSISGKKQPNVTNIDTDTARSCADVFARLYCFCCECLFLPFCTSVFWTCSAQESETLLWNRTCQKIICAAMSNYKLWGRQYSTAMLFWNCLTMTCRFQRACCQDAVKDCLAGADCRGVRGDDHATGTASDWPKEYRVGTCWKPWIPWVENIQNATQKWFKHICCLTPLMTAIVAY